MRKYIVYETNAPLLTSFPPLAYPFHTALIPLAYPFHTPLIPLPYPFHTPLIPLPYPFHTALIPLAYLFRTPYLPLPYPFRTPCKYFSYPLFTPLIPLSYTPPIPLSYPSYGHIEKVLASYTRHTCCFSPGKFRLLLIVCANSIGTLLPSLYVPLLPHSAAPASYDNYICEQLYV